MTTTSPPPIPLADGTTPGRTLSIIEVSGEGREAGARQGEAARDLIHLHLERAVARNQRRKQLDRDETYRRADAFREIVSSELPSIAAEIDGIALGAGIDRSAAWLLQLRAEVSRFDPADLPHECTSFGATAAATRTATTIAGQNGDLPAFYTDVLVLIRRRRSDGPDYLTLTPAGQVSWHGINEAGVAIFANFLYSGGWRPGIPRYLFTRIAMDHVTAKGAAAHLIGLRRGSSRNVLIADESTVLDVELAVDRAGLIEASDGVLVHANHHVSDIGDVEIAPEDYLRNSRARQDRLGEILRCPAGDRRREGGRRPPGPVVPTRRSQPGTGRPVLRRHDHHRQHHRRRGRPPAVDRARPAPPRRLSPVPSVRKQQVRR